MKRIARITIGLAVVSLTWLACIPASGLILSERGNQAVPDVGWPDPSNSNRQYAPEQVVTVAPSDRMNVKVVYE